MKVDTGSNSGIKVDDGESVNLGGVVDKSIVCEF